MVASLGLYASCYGIKTQFCCLIEKFSKNAGSVIFTYLIHDPKRKKLTLLCGKHRERIVLRAFFRYNQKKNYRIEKRVNT